MIVKGLKPQNVILLHVDKNASKSLELMYKNKLMHGIRSENKNVRSQESFNILTKNAQVCL